MLTGRCLCGAVRYEVRAEPLFATKCYCEDCQRESGAGHLTLVASPQETVTLMGATKRFAKPADSGKSVMRTFCPVCGTTLLGQPEVISGISMVRAGTLDDSSTIKVRTALFGGSARIWDRPAEELRVYEAMPPAR